MRSRTLREQRTAESWLRYTSGQRRQPPIAFDLTRLIGFASSAFVVALCFIFIGARRSSVSESAPPAGTMVEQRRPVDAEAENPVAIDSSPDDPVSR